MHFVWTFHTIICRVSVRGAQQLRVGGRLQADLHRYPIRPLALSPDTLLREGKTKLLGN